MNRGRAPFGGPVPSFGMGMGSGPGGPAPGPPVSRDPNFYYRSAALKDDNPSTLVQVQYTDHPKYTTAALFAPNLFYATAAQYIKSDQAGNPALWILGSAEIGVDGGVVVVPFDIPTNQVAQLSCVCQSLKISARLYLVPPALSGVSIDEETFFNPPIYSGGILTPDVVVQAMIGEGHSGESNLTRRARFPGNTNTGGTLSCPIPAMANAVTILGRPSGVTVSQNYTNQGGTQGPGAMPLDNLEHPLTDGCNRILLIGTAAGLSFDVIFRLGFGGL